MMVGCVLAMVNDVSGPVAFRQMEKTGATRITRTFDPERLDLLLARTRSAGGEGLDHKLC